MGKQLEVFLTVFFYFKIFVVKNAKIDFFKEKMVLRVVFIKLTFRWLQTGLSDLKKTNNLTFCYGRFLRIFKNVAFSKKIEIFEFHQ